MAKITFMNAPFEILEHPADVGFRARGGTPQELLENAALAVMTLACEPAAIEERERRDIQVTGRGFDALLFAWLAEILAIADAEKMFFRRAEVLELVFDGEQVRARGAVYGERCDRSRHAAGTSIKAVTYHQLQVVETPEGWQATVFLDV